MSSRRQKRAIERELQSGLIPMPVGRFERVANSLRVRCVLCHASGFGDVNPTVWSLSPWQVPCVLEHPSACRCGLTFHSPGHLSQHTKFTRWPERRLEHGPA